MSITVHCNQAFRWEMWAKSLDALRLLIGPFRFIDYIFLAITIFSFFFNVLLIFSPILYSVLILSVDFAYPSICLFLFFSFIYVLFSNSLSLRIIVSLSFHSIRFLILSK